MGTRCGDHPTRTQDDELCPICLISVKVEVARGMQQLSAYLRPLGGILGLVLVARSRGVATGATA